MLAERTARNAKLPKRDAQSQRKECCNGPGVLASGWARRYRSEEENAREEQHLDGSDCSRVQLHGKDSKHGRAGAAQAHKNATPGVSCLCCISTVA